MTGGAARTGFSEIIRAYAFMNFKKRLDSCLQFANESFLNSEFDDVWERSSQSSD